MSERITIKSQREIELMRAAGAVVRDTLLLLEKSAAIGMTTEELNKIAEDFIRSQGAIPSFLNYEGYPKSICTSVNEQVVHGIPGGYKLKDGDIISVDVGAILNGYHGDAARTILIGNVKDEVKQLVEVTRGCFFRGMEQAVAGNHIADIGAAVEQCAHDHGYGVVRELVGHGIGTSMHEPPEVPNFVDKRHGRGPRLYPGMTIAIEPMITLGTADVVVLKDGWTVVTRDAKPAAHYENTVAITANGKPEILTL